MEELEPGEPNRVASNRVHIRVGTRRGHFTSGEGEVDWKCESRVSRERCH